MAAAASTSLSSASKIGTHALAFEAGGIVDAVGALADPRIVSARLFDCYRGQPIPAGKKSLAYTIEYRAADRTLTDDELTYLIEELL